MATDEFAKVIRSMTRFHEVPVDLAAITAPTLVLYGEHGLPSVKRHAAELAARFPDAEVDVVPGAGHAANLDNPDGFTDALRRFLDRVYGDGATADDGGDSAA